MSGAAIGGAGLSLRVSPAITGGAEGEQGVALRFSTLPPRDGAPRRNGTIANNSAALKALCAYGETCCGGRARRASERGLPDCDLEEPPRRRNLRIIMTATDRILRTGLLAMGACALAATAPAHAQYRQKISNNLNNCGASSGPSVLVTVEGVSASKGTIRVQSYRGTAADWLKKGRWLNRVEAPARAGTMTFCLPVPAAGTYAIAVRHDLNGNGDTDLTQDGGGMSNNPSINIFNLGKPSYKKTAFAVGDGVKSIRIRMRYM
jgi:uncharacterized protein (DUF2141 family)